MIANIMVVRFWLEKAFSFDDKNPLKSRILNFTTHKKLGSVKYPNPYQIKKKCSIYKGFRLRSLEDKKY